MRLGIYDDNHHHDIVDHDHDDDDNHRGANHHDDDIVDDNHHDHRSDRSRSRSGIGYRTGEVAVPRLGFVWFREFRYFDRVNWCSGRVGRTGSLARGAFLASTLAIGTVALLGSGAANAASAGAPHSRSANSAGRGPEIRVGSAVGIGQKAKDHGSGGVQTSLNWAGYIDTGATFSNVAGTWTQPAASCPENQVQQAAFWVGIGGYVQGDPDIEQVGTDSDCVKGKGKKAGGPNYYAWYQMYPQALFVLPTSSFPVSPGETIESSVTLSGTDKYTLDITDVGHWTYSTVQSQAAQPADESAEWITEAPSSCKSGGKCKVLPLADFTAVAYSAASANGESISGSGLTDTQINMTSKNGKTVRAQTSSLGSGGSSFSVTWKSN